jgi:hypothetical protein
VEDGGFIYADALNADTLAVAIARHPSMRTNMLPKQAIQWSQVSNHFRAGFMITKNDESFEAFGFCPRFPILKTSPRRARPAKYLRIGSRS